MFFAIYQPSISEIWPIPYETIEEAQQDIDERADFDTDEYQIIECIPKLLCTPPDLRYTYTEL